MKGKYVHLLLLIIIIAVSFISCSQNEKLPEIVTKEFPIYIEYLVGDSSFVIDDTVICEFKGFVYNHGHKSPSIIREWSQKLKSTNDNYSAILIVEEYKKKSIFKDRINTCSFVYLSLGEAEYYMGEDEYKEITAPCFYYYESFENETGTESAECTVLTEEQLKKFFDIEIIKFSYETPVVNRFK